jgi:hypothetical protein
VKHAGWRAKLVRWGVLLAALGQAAPARASSCPIFTPVLFSYPSAERLTVPANAVPFVVPDSLVKVKEAYVDWERAPQPPSDDLDRLESYFLDLGPLLTPGHHRFGVVLAEQPHSIVRDPEVELDLEIEVDPVAAPLPDEVASARIVQVLHFEPEHELSPRYGGYLDQLTRLQGDPLDCSQIVTDQAPFACLGGGRPGRGDHFVQIEAEGDPLGFAINGRLMPGHCRSAFFPPGDEGFEIQVVTPTGLGRVESFSGEVEAYVAPESPRPRTGEQTPPGLWQSCDLSSRRGSGAPSSRLGLGLLLALAALRRCPPEKARVRDAGPRLDEPRPAHRDSSLAQARKKRGSARPDNV